MANSMEGPLNTVWFCNSFPGYILRENYNLKDTCTQIFKEALLTIIKTWKQPKCSSTEDWIKKMWYKYTIKYFSATHKKSGMMPFAATWMDIEVITLSKVTQKDNNKYYIISLIYKYKMWHKWTHLWNRKILT